MFEVAQLMIEPLILKELFVRKGNKGEFVRTSVYWFLGLYI